MQISFITIPSDMLLMFSKALVPVLKGAKASSVIMEPKRAKSSTASCTSGRREPMSSTSWQRNMA